MSNRESQLYHQRILHIIHGLTIGGAEVDLINKSIALTQRYGYSITICCLRRRGQLASRAEAAGISVMGPLMRQRYDILAGRRLRQILLAEPWSLVHTHLFAGNFVGYATRMTLPSNRRPPLIASEHAMADRWGRVPLFIDRLIQHQAALILVPSQAAASSYVAHGIRPGRLRAISNAVDVERFEQVDPSVARTQIREELRISQNAYLVGTICRLEAVKGLPILLEAIKTLPVHLIIVGDGPERERLNSIIQNQSLNDRVQLLGTRSDVPQILGALDLFVLASYSESFGIAVAEALLMETPVVATDVGGIPEVTCGEKYARLVPAGDGKALRNAIQWMIEHRESARAQAQGGHSFVRDSMSIESVAGEQHAIYQEIIASK